MFDPKLVERKIYRGAQPSTSADFGKLQELGIKYILDLETGAKWLNDGSLADEAVTAIMYGMSLIPHPLGAIAPPTSDQLELGSDILDQFGNAGIYIHCRQGVDRTGMMVAWYRLNVSNWTRVEAVKEWDDYGRHWWYFFWVWSFLSYE